MNKKHIIMIMAAIAVCMLCVLCGCGGTSDEASDETTAAETTAEAKMSTDQLTDIALKDIGFGAAAVSDLAMKEDGDNAIITFKAEGKECSYTINAYTGEIVEKSVPEGIGEGNESDDPGFDAVLDRAFEEIEGFDGQMTNVKESAEDGVTTISFDWNGNHYEYRYDQEKKEIIE